MSELKPCPCCGTGGTYIADDPGGWMITCTGCFLRTTHYPTKEEAVSHWNCRAPDPDTVELVRELRHQLMEANARIAEALAHEESGNYHTDDLRHQHDINDRLIARADKALEEEKR